MRFIEAIKFADPLILKDPETWKPLLKKLDHERSYYILYGVERELDQLKKENEEIYNCIPSKIIELARSSKY